VWGVHTVLKRQGQNRDAVKPRERKKSSNFRRVQRAKSTGVMGKKGGKTKAQVFKKKNRTALYALRKKISGSLH